MVAVNIFKIEAPSELQVQVLEAKYWMSGLGLKFNFEKQKQSFISMYNAGQYEIKTGMKSKPSIKAVFIIVLFFCQLVTFNSHVENPILKTRKHCIRCKHWVHFLLTVWKIKLLTTDVYSKLYYGSMLWLVPNLQKYCFQNWSPIW